MSGNIGVVQEYGEGQSGTVENVEYDESYDYGYAGVDAYAGQELEQDKGEDYYQNFVYKLRQP